MNDPLLAGLTVLDFTRVLAGPYCTRLLADLGARVIKIERPGFGDDTRRGLMQLEPDRDDQGTYFIRCNAGKLSVALDLAHREARALVADLTRQADVVVENFVPGVMARLGYDYPRLAAIKPDLIYCSISGYGQAGPLSGRQAFAHIINAFSGLMRLEQQGDSEPRVAYLQAADVLAGLHAQGAILGALLRRTRTGAGAYLDVSMMEALIAADDLSYGMVLNGGQAWALPRSGMLVHEIGGRHLVMQTVGSPDLWPRLLKLLGRPELGEDPRFATPISRRENWPAIRDIIVAWLGRFKTVDEALEAFSGARIPCAPVLSPEEVVAHPHMEERGTFPTIPHPGRGSARITATPFHLDGTAVPPGGPAPYRVGEHTRQVLREVLGYSPARIAELLERGVVAAPDGPLADR